MLLCRRPGNKYFDPVIRHNGTFVKTSGYCTDLFYTAALGWIKEVKDEDAPFFAYITTNAPHGPFIAPEKNAKRFTDLGFEEKTAGFYGMIENIDENVGRLLDKLEEWDLFEDTVVIFMSDNGMTGGGSGRGRDGGRQGGRRQRDGSLQRGHEGPEGQRRRGGVRVPFLVRWDGVLEPGRDIGTVAAHIDVLPTLAALAGAGIPEAQVEGRSLLPLIEDEGAEWADRYLFTHRGRWKTGEDPTSPSGRDSRCGTQKFRFVDNEFLYDMESDPGQEVNVIEKYPEVVKAMREAYDAWWKETVPMMVNEDAPMSEVRPYHQWYEEQMEGPGIAAWEEPEL